MYGQCSDSEFMVKLTAFSLSLSCCFFYTDVCRRFCLKTFKSLFVVSVHHGSSFGVATFGGSLDQVEALQELNPQKCNSM